MHRITHSLKRITAAELPTVKELDGTERAATEQELLAPILSEDDARDHRLVNAESQANALLRFTGGINSTNFRYVLASQFVVGVPIAGEVGRAALRNLVPHVVRVGAEKKVAGVDALTVVAMVQHADPMMSLASGDRAKVQFPRNAVGQHHRDPDGDLPVTARIGLSRSRPMPTFIRPANGNLAPKTNGNRLSFHSHNLQQKRAKCTG